MPTISDRKYTTRDPVDRFAEKVALTDAGCLVWLAARQSNGYGVFFLRKNGRTSVMALAHRWSYEYHVGPVPDGLEIDHLCRNRACVNPDHLEPVTCAENNRRKPPEVRRSGGTPRQSHCHRGHPLADPNLYYQPKNGKRFCKACRDIAAAKMRSGSTVAPSRDVDA